MERKPYDIIKSMLISEKANMLMGLKNAESNACVKACKSPKYVFEVDLKANKNEIKLALEEIYKKRAIKVVSVNTIISKPKCRYFRGKAGATKFYKKAIVTLREGDSLDDNE